MLVIAKTSESALEYATANPVDLVLADIHMPHMDGRTLLIELKKLDDPPFFLALTSIDTDELILELLSLGAEGFILKSQQPDSILQSIHDVLAGGVVVGPQALRSIIGYLPNQNLEARTNLDVILDGSITNVEKEILLGISRGESNAAIATATGFAESTIKMPIVGSWSG